MTGMQANMPHESVARKGSLDASIVLIMLLPRTTC